MTENGLIGVLIPLVLCHAVTAHVQGTGAVYLTIPQSLMERHVSVRTLQRNRAIKGNVR
ncbi:hypothetical protein ACJMK2_015710, partial [Sinanodonta woodiana]